MENQKINANKLRSRSLQSNEKKDSKIRETYNQT